MPMPSWTGSPDSRRLPLLGAQLVDAEQLEGPRRGRLVVAGVVGEAGDRRVRELVMLDPVARAQLHRVHAELGGQLVDHALDRERGLRSSRTADGVGRGGVGEHAGAAELVRVHLVDPGEHEHPQQRGAGGDDLQVGAHVREQGHLHAQQRAVLRGCQLQVLDLVAAMVGRHHVLAAGLVPLDGPAEHAGQLQGEDLLAVHLQLAAEAAADVRRDDAQVLLGDPRAEGEHDAEDVGDLRRRPDRHLVAHAHGCGDDRTRLHERRHDPLVHETALDDDVRLGGHLVVSAAEVVDVAGVVGRGVMDERAARGHRIDHVDDGGQRLVLDVDRGDRVLRERGTGREDDGDHVADMPHLVARQRGERWHDRVVRHGPHAQDVGVHVAQARCVIGSHDSRHGERAGQVDLDDAGVRHRAAHQAHVHGARQLDVVGPVRAAVEELRVLLATDRAADRVPGLEDLGHFVPPISSAACCTDLTMLW